MMTYVCSKVKCLYVGVYYSEGKCEHKIGIWTPLIPCQTHFPWVLCHFHGCMCRQFPYCQRRAWGTCCILSSASEWWEAESLPLSLLRWAWSSLTTWEQRRREKKHKWEFVFFVSPLFIVPGGSLFGASSLFTQPAGCPLSWAANLTRHAERKKIREITMATRTWRKNNRTDSASFSHSISSNLNGSGIFQTIHLAVFSHSLTPFKYCLLSWDLFFFSPVVSECYP